MADQPIYLDYNATTPIDPAVADAMLPFLYGKFGNPSSSHIFGAEAKKAVEEARRKVAEMLGCRAEEIIFTSGGSEANNLAIKGAAFANRGKGNHIITSSVEHPSVLEVCEFLETQGFKVTYLPVDEYGMVDPLDVENAITAGTILISIMHANNEVGTVQPIERISKIAHSHDILMHTDAAQSIGKIPVRTNELGADLLSIAGHKLYAPKGVGALFIRIGVDVSKQTHGASHERNFRAGTENVMEIAGLGSACALIPGNLGDWSEQMKENRDFFEQEIKTLFPWIKVNGHPEKRLPNTSSISFRGIEANTILSKMTGVAASAGAACHADQVDISHVLKAMKVPVEYAMGTIRFSIGRTTSREEMLRAIDEIASVIQRLKTPDDDARFVEGIEQVRLTRFTHGLGCACKLRPQLLEQVISDMPVASDTRVLVGTETADDAAVYLLNTEQAIVQTVDFFTPIVDDPYLFGAISAANSLSDIYAMGAKPLFALSVVGFPSNRLSIGVLKEILRGAAEKAKEAGVSIIGGHTVDDTEPKFGLAVTGVVHPKKIWKNMGAQVGDVLVLTKPIGTGILTTALKQELLEEKDIEEAIIAMVELNKLPSEIAEDLNIHACTDITGFGLLGHLLGMMKASRTSAEIDLKKVPILPNAYDLAVSGIIPGGTKSNISFTESHIRYSPEVSPAYKALINDAQTSGGLLFSMPKDQAELFMNRLWKAGKTSYLIGSIIEQDTKKILIQ